MSEDKEPYNLYTEKIVKNPWNKIRKILAYIAKVIGSAILFSVTASIVFLLIYPTARKFVKEEETPTRTKVVIPTDSQSNEEVEDSTKPDGEKSGEGEYDDETESNEIVTDENGETVESKETEEGNKESASDELSIPEETQLEESRVNEIFDEKISEAFNAYRPGMTEMNSVYAGMKGIIGDLNKSIVNVMLSDNGEDWMDSLYSENNNTFGLIVSEDEEYYYILTLLDDIFGRKYIMVNYKDGAAATATYVSGDVTTGLAILSSPKEEIESSVQIKVAALGNSYLVQQGDPMVLMGRLQGENGMAVYGMTAAKNTYMDTDSNYRMLYSDVTAKDEDKGIMVNTAGEVVAVITYNGNRAARNVVSGYGISELKTLIERMINGKVTPYIGIRPQNVTAAMQSLYQMPKGVYVTEVESDSPAYVYGIQAGDVITAVDDVLTVGIREMMTELYGKESGSEVEFTIMRPGKDEYREIKIKLELGVE